jgi:hypothetical protein
MTWYEVTYTYINQSSCSILPLRPENISRVGVLGHHLALVGGTQLRAGPLACVVSPISLNSVSVTGVLLPQSEGSARCCHTYIHALIWFGKASLDTRQGNSSWFSYLLQLKLTSCMYSAVCVTYVTSPCSRRGREAQWHARYPQQG